MPRVGCSLEELTSGGQFKFTGNKGEVTDVIAIAHVQPWGKTEVGYDITIQQLDHAWNHTGTEVVEFVKWGESTKFHPGLANSSEDNSPTLEIGQAGDAGDGDGATGTCILSVTGAGPDKKGKMGIFVDAAMRSGFKASVFNGYGPNLVGLQAEFTRFMMEKVPGTVTKEDPTALIIGREGHPVGPECVHRYPHSMSGAAAAQAPTSAQTAAAPAPRRAAPRASTQAPAAPAPAPAPVAAAPVNGTATADYDWAKLKAQLTGQTEPTAIASALLDTFAVTAAGQSIPYPARFCSKLITTFPKAGVVQANYKAVQDQVKDAGWFKAQAEDLGWEFDGATVRIPAAI